MRCWPSEACCSVAAVSLSSLTSVNGPGGAWEAVFTGNSGWRSETCSGPVWEQRGSPPCLPVCPGGRLACCYRQLVLWPLLMLRSSGWSSACAMPGCGYRQRMRRENPLASDEEVEARVQAWLRRPNGEAGDRLGFPRW